MIENRTSVAVAATAVSLTVAGWELASRLAWISPLFFPPPTRIIETVVLLCASGRMPTAITVTLSRLIAGGSAGALFGTVSGWALGSNPPLRAAIDPMVAALHPLPKLALFPLFLVFLGVGEQSRIALVAVATFFPMLVSVMHGVLQIDKLYFEIAKSYGSSRWIILTRVVVPGSLPAVMTGLRVSINTALVVVIAVEMLSSQSGLGFMAWMAWQTMRVHELYAVLVVIAALGVIFNAILSIGSRRLGPWQR